MSLCIISAAESDLSRLLSLTCPGSEFLTFAEAARADLNGYNAFALLCGTRSGNQSLLPGLRNKVEEQIRQGKRFFSEFCQVIGNLRSYDVKSTRYERPVVLDNALPGLELDQGLILDEQSNERLVYFNAGGRALLQYVANPVGFYKVEDAAKISPKGEDYALFLAEENLLVASFRICNFARARFAPAREWSRLLAGLVNWLGGSCQPGDVLPLLQDTYRLATGQSDLDQCVRKGIDWYFNADMLVWQNSLPYAVKEGLGTHVYADGSQQVLAVPRADCVGEVALAFYLYHLHTRQERFLAWSDSLMQLVLDSQVKQGPHAGMMRWTQTSWWVCYQDDAARALLLPLLIRSLLSGDKSQLGPVKDCLDFLIATTGSDGLRFCRTDYVAEDKDAYTIMGVVWDEKAKKWAKHSADKKVFTQKELQEMATGCVSAHYNATYLASCLLYYHLTGEEKYFATGVRGLETIMASYPVTAREHSQTQELCRLILPLALLWQTSSKAEHRAWLYQVSRDLEKLRHPEGGYLEWDTGYIAVCAGVEGGESSVLARNGDPVTDLLYSANWLPLGFGLAFYFTKDQYFKDLRDDINSFFASAQLLSPDPLLDGAWPRSLDLDRREVYGVPNDIGWAPWSIESGWTVGEILSGLLLGLLEP